MLCLLNDLYAFIGSIILTSKNLRELAHDRRDRTYKEEYITTLGFTGYLTPQSLLLWRERPSFIFRYGEPWRAGKVVVDKFVIFGGLKLNRCTSVRERA
uniref:Uncharacterized protein n=1 Tax=Solanum lycopersicum TaxID=4081 RepID=A0A3Q7HJE9_SOLLC